LWFAFGMIPTIVPLYGSFVLGIDNSLVLSLLLATGFLSAAIFVFTWRYLIKKVGAKKAFILAIIILIATLSPFMFISDAFSAFVAFFLLGIGLAGALIVRDVVISIVVDEDELKTGIRREGSFYGVNGFVAKLTNVFVFISIAIIFNSVGWAVFDPKGTTENTILGLRALMFIFPAIVLLIGLIAMLYFPITKEKYTQITKEAQKLHLEKKEKILKS